MGKKIRVTLSIDDQIWHDLQRELSARKYPRGIASWLAQQAFESTLLEMECIGQSQQLELIFGKKEKK